MDYRMVPWPILVVLLTSGGLVRAEARPENGQPAANPSAPAPAPRRRAPIKITAPPPPPPPEEAPPPQSPSQLPSQPAACEWKGQTYGDGGQCYLGGCAGGAGAAFGKVNICSSGAWVEGACWCKFDCGSFPPC